MREAVIAGVAATRQARFIDDATSVELAFEAMTAALSDAGLSVGDVDGLAVEWPGPGGAPDEAASWAQLLGVVPRWVTTDPMSCMGIRGVANAIAAVSASKEQKFTRGHPKKQKHWASAQFIRKLT